MFTDSYSHNFSIDHRYESSMELKKILSLVRAYERSLIAHASSIDDLFS